MPLKEDELRRYSQALDERVCSACRAIGHEGICAIGERGECPIQAHLPRLVEAVLSTPRSREIRAYIPRVRDLVCSACVGQDEQGVCARRDMASCGIDSLLLLIVETIEEVHDRLRSSGV